MEPGEGREHLPLAVAGRRPDRLALEVLGPSDGRVFPTPHVQRRLVEHHADDLGLRPATDRGDDHGAVGQPDVGAAGVYLGDRVSRALGVLHLDVEAFGLVVAAVERDPVRGVVAHREPVEREGHLLRRLRLGRARPGSDEQRECERDDRQCACHERLLSSDVSAQGAIQRAARTTAPYTASPITEIHTSAANATGVFMLPCVVMMT